MIHREIDGAVLLDRATTKFPDAFDAEHCLESDVAEKTDVFWLDLIELVGEPEITGIDLALAWSAIVWRAAAHRVGDEKLLAVKACGDQHLIE